MTAKWTKGPWSIDHCLEHKQKDDPGYFQIDAPVTCELTRKGFSYTVADTMNRDYCISPEEDRANAQLIASAPDLAERLELTNQQIKHAMDVLQGQHESTWQSLSDCLHANAAALRAARGEKGDNNVDTQ